MSDPIRKALVFKPAFIRRNVAICILTTIAAVGLYYVLPSSLNELARRTLPILLVAAVFWATEALPLFATSLCVIGIEILFLSQRGGLAGLLPSSSPWPLGADGSALKLSYVEFLKPFASPVIFLFMGGFLLSRAVTKHGLDRLIGAKLIRPFAQSPIMLIFGILGITAFFSMWMSNTATTAMMLAIIAPMLRHLPKEERFSRAIILAVPFGANIGGIGTPIGTPPNAVAMAALKQAGYPIGFVDWMIMAVPLAVLMLVAAGLLLYIMFRPSKDLVLPTIEKPGKIGTQGWVTLMILIATIVLWLTSKWHGVSPTAVALLAAAALTSFRVLDRHDVDSIDWNVLILMWGGLSLGHAMNKTGLINAIIDLPIVTSITHMPGLTGVMVLGIFFVILAVVLSTFMSNTATAALIIPMAIAISPNDHGALAIITTLACSFAMAMPVSTPPNAMAFASGNVSVGSMIRTGGLLSVLGVLVLVVGYQPMSRMFLKASQPHSAARRVALLIPMSGPYAATGQLQKRGYDMALKEASPLFLEVKVFDTYTDPSAIGQLLDTQVMAWRPDIIVGPYDSEAAAGVLRYMADKKVPVILPTANADPLTQQPGTPIFRLAPPQQMMALTAGDFIAAQRKSWNLHEIVVLAEDTPYGQACSQSIAGACLIKSLPAVRTVLFRSGAPAPDERTQMALTPTSLLIVVSRQVADCQRIVDAYGPTARIFGFSGGFSTPRFRAYIQTRRAQKHQDLYALSPWQANKDDPVSQRFVAAYRHAYPQETVDPQYHTAQAYSAMRVATRAISQAHQENSTLLPVLKSLKVQTPLGQVQFIDFGGYYQQNPTRAVVHLLDGG